MTRHGWFAADGKRRRSCSTRPTDERWAAAFKAEGVDPRLLVSETGSWPELTYKEFFIFAFGRPLG